MGGNESTSKTMHLYDNEFLRQIQSHFHKKVLRLRGTQKKRKWPIATIDPIHEIILMYLEILLSRDVSFFYSPNHRTFAKKPTMGPLYCFTVYYLVRS